MAYAVVCLFESVALPTAVEYLFPEIRIATLWHVLDAPVHLGFVAIGVGASVVMTWINVIGIRTAAFVQTAITGAILLAGVILLHGCGRERRLVQCSTAHWHSRNGNPHRAHHGARADGGFRCAAAVGGRDRSAGEPDRLAADRVACYGRPVVRGHLLRRGSWARCRGARRLDRCDRRCGHGALGRIVGGCRAHCRWRRRHSHKLERVHHLRQPRDVRVVGIRRPAEGVLAAASEIPHAVDWRDRARRSCPAFRRSLAGSSWCG